MCSILHLLALICLICLFGAGIVEGGKRPRIWHLLEIVRLGEIAFLGAITDLEEQSSTWRALPPIEGSLKLKSGAFLSPTTRALSVGMGPRRPHGRLLGLYEGHLGRPRGWTG